MLIDNCQGGPLGYILSMFCRNVVISTIAIHELADEKNIARLAESIPEHYDIVLSVPLSDDFGPISVRCIAKNMNGRPTVIVPNFYFSGLHPDTFYIGEQGDRIGGPLGDYHSRLVVLAYARNIPAESAQKLFCDHIYDGFSYYAEWEKSIAESTRRERHVDVPFTAEMEHMLVDDLCFFTPNHPTSFLLVRYCLKLAKWLAQNGLSEFVDWPSYTSTFPNELAEGAIFPIFPEIAERFKLGFQGNYLFTGPTVGGTNRRRYTLEEFIRAEYACFSTICRKQFLHFPHVGNLLDFAASVT